MSDMTDSEIIQIFKDIRNGNYAAGKIFYDPKLKKFVKPTPTNADRRIPYVPEDGSFY